MNRIKDIIEGREVEALLRATIDNIYVNGPVSISDMETLSYIKYYHAELFEKYKQSIPGLILPNVFLYFFTKCFITRITNAKSN